MKDILHQAVDLLATLKDVDLESFEIEGKDRRFRFSRAPSAAASPGPAPATEPGLTARSEAPPVVREPEVDQESHYVPICSPMVGMFYRCTEPGRPPMVEVGQVLHPGEPVCIIEAMKLMNVIKADVEGKIVKALVENETPVQAGQVLFLVDPL